MTILANNTDISELVKEANLLKNNPNYYVIFTKRPVLAGASMIDISICEKDKNHGVNILIISGKDAKTVTTYTFLSTQDLENLMTNFPKEKYPIIGKILNDNPPKPSDLINNDNIFSSSNSIKNF